MGLLRLLVRGTRDAAEEYGAKRDLERKLGRKVSEEELYSLGSHLDAAGEGNPQAPLISTPRESSVPFGDAKPPMKFTTKLILFGIPLLLLVIALPVAYVALMSENQYNRLNPWTPKPPEGTFPAQLGAFRLKEKPDWYGAKSYNPVEYWQGDYTNGTNYVTQKLWNYKSEAELNAAFDEKKKYITPTDKFKVLDDSASRYAITFSGGNSVYVVYKDGMNLRQLSGSAQKPVYEVEGALKNAPPVEVVPINVSELDTPKTTTTSGSSLTVLQLLDDFKRDETAAEKKYKDKTISVTGTVAVSDKDKSGKPMVAFMRPGSTKPADGMVICSFDKSQEAVTSKIKKDDTVTLQGKFSMSLIGNVMLEGCTKR